MKHKVLNPNIGSPNSFDYPRLTTQQNHEILAELFEQILLFDNVTITTNRLNFGLAFLIDRLGLSTVERLLESGYIKLMIYSPVLVTGRGRQDENGNIDNSIIFGQPPIAAGSLSREDLEPERNIHYALSNFSFPSKTKKDFTKKAIKNYVVPNGMEVSTYSEKLIIDAYLNNNLVNLGLPYGKDPDQLDLDQRSILLELGHKVIETSILSNYGLKSYENFEYLEICEQNISNIGKAFNIAGNTSEILKIENVPNLKELYLRKIVDFDSVFKLRHLSTAKYYRNWINTVGESSNCYEVTEAYLNEIKGKGKFFETNKGKFIKNLGSLSIKTGLNELISKPMGAIVGGVVGSTVGGPTGALLGSTIGVAAATVLNPIADYSLGLLETFWLDNLLKGKNPSMFIEGIKKEINERN